MVKWLSLIGIENNYIKGLNNTETIQKKVVELDDGNRKRLKEYIHKNVHKMNAWNKIPAITRDLKYIYLCWEYNDMEVNVKSADYNLISAIQETINIYLEEIEND